MSMIGHGILIEVLGTKYSSFPGTKPAMVVQTGMETSHM
jgi:hypothetical protein